MPLRILLLGTLLALQACREPNATNTLVAEPQSLPRLTSRGAIATAVVTVRWESGALVRGARVFAGTMRALDPTSERPCNDPGSRFLSLTGGTSNSSGQASVPVPEGEVGDSSDCIWALAELRDTTALVGEPVRGYASARRAARPARLGDTVRIELTMQSRAPGPGRRLPDDEWATLANTTVPGFAGVFYEGCTIVVRVKNPSANGAGALAWANGPSGPPGQCGGPSRRVEIRPADFDFGELRRFSDRAAILTSLEAVYTFDIDEVRNRIALDVIGQSTVRRIARAMDWIRVPNEAIVVSAGPELQKPPIGPAVERWGTRLAPDTAVFSPVWSSDSRELFFLSSAGKVMAVNVASGAVRFVTTAPATTTSTSTLRLSANGQSVLFTLLHPGGKYALYRAPANGGQAEEISRALATPWFAVSGDGGRYALTWSVLNGSVKDEAFGIIEPSSGQSIRIVEGATAARALEFSRDGSRLLYAPGNPAGNIFEYSLVDRASRQVGEFDPASQVRRLLSVAYSGQSPLFLVAHRHDNSQYVVLEDSRSMVVQRMLTLPRGPYIVSSAGWLPDAGKVAAWFMAATQPYQCMMICISIPQYLQHWQMLVASPLASGGLAAAEMATVSEHVPVAVMAPDGSRVAHNMGGKLYVLKAP
jgi:hypothetical protein